MDNASDYPIDYRIERKDAPVFLKDLNDFAGMNEVYGKYFKNETAPARTTIQVARIPKDSLVEIEVVAYI